jgi:hypothetical protein
VHIHRPLAQWHQDSQVPRIGVTRNSQADSVFFIIVLFWFACTVQSWFPLLRVELYTIFFFGVSSGYVWNLSASAETSSFESPIYTVGILSLASLCLIRCGTSHYFHLESYRESIPHKIQSICMQSSRELLYISTTFYVQRYFSLNPSEKTFQITSNHCFTLYHSPFSG